MNQGNLALDLHEHITFFKNASSLVNLLEKRTKNQNNH